MPNPLSRRLRRRWLPQALAVLLVVTQIQAAEQAAAPPQAPAARHRPALLQHHSPRHQRLQRQAASAQLPVEQSLKILVLAGNGEMNDLERRVMAPLVVQVVDQNERPVEGAEVVFRFPLNGPSATFPGGKSSAHGEDQRNRSGACPELDGQRASWNFSGPRECQLWQPGGRGHGLDEQRHAHCRTQERRPSTKVCGPTAGSRSP